MIQFIMLFASMLLLSAILINGFYAITRGDWYLKADGTKFWDGMIFSFWSKFLQQHTIEYEYYHTDQLLKQYDIIKDFFKNPNSEIVDFFADGIAVRKMDTKKAALFFSYCFGKGVLTSLAKHEKNEDQMLLYIFKEVKKYKIPYWVQAPLGQCITCMASVFGTLSWIFWYQIVVQVQKVYQTNPAFMLIEMPILSKVFLWITFCISLAYLNTLFFNINQKLSK